MTGLSGWGVAVVASASLPPPGLRLHLGRQEEAPPVVASRPLYWDHETPKLLALSFNPSRGPFGPSADGWPSTPSADFCRVVERSCDHPSPMWDTWQISRGKSGSLPRILAGFTAVILDGYGLRSALLARPITIASYPVSVRRDAISLHASFRRSLAAPPLRFARASPPSGCTGDFHPQAAGHARHTARRLRRPASRLQGLTSTTRPRMGIDAVVTQPCSPLWCKVSSISATVW
jgi:hypothetical protein